LPSPQADCLARRHGTLKQRNGFLSRPQIAECTGYLFLEFLSLSFPFYINISNFPFFSHIASPPEGLPFRLSCCLVVLGSFMVTRRRHSTGAFLPVQSLALPPPQKFYPPGPRPLPSLTIFEDLTTAKVPPTNLLRAFCRALALGSVSFFFRPHCKRLLFPVGACGRCFNRVGRT